LSGRRIVVPETRELGQLVRMLEEHGAEAIPCPMIAILAARDAEPVAAWLRWLVKGTCDDLVLMTGEGLRRLLSLARRIDLESAFLDALRTTRKIARGPTRNGKAGAAWFARPKIRANGSPLWVICGNGDTPAPCPFFPLKQTFVSAL